MRDENPVLRGIKTAIASDGVMPPELTAAVDAAEYVRLSWDDEPAIRVGEAAVDEIDGTAVLYSKMVPAGWALLSTRLAEG